MENLLYEVVYISVNTFFVRHRNSSIVDRYKETFDTWNKVANLYQDKFMDLDLYDDTYDTFCEEVNVENATILEIGCGPGNITNIFLTKDQALELKELIFRQI